MPKQEHLMIPKSLHEDSYISSLVKTTCNTFRYLILFLILCLPFCEVTLAANVQNVTADISATLKAAKAKSVKVLESISSRISALEKIETPDNLQKSELTWLNQARDFLEKNITSVNHTLEYYQASQGVPQRLKSIEKELDEPLPSDLKINEKLPLDIIEAQLETKRSELETARRVRAEIEAEATQRNERLQKIADESASTRKRLEELKQALGIPADVVGDKVSDAKNKALSAEQTYLEQLLQEAEHEGRSYENRRELLRARRQLAERHVLIAESQFNILELFVNRLRTEAAAQAILAADAASLAAVSAHPLVRAIIDENQTLAAELAKILVSSTTLSRDKQQLEETLNTTRRRFDGIKEKIAQIGLTDAIGLKLRSDRNQLPDAERYRLSLNAHYDEINRVQLRRIEIEDRLLDLVDLKRESLRRVNISKTKLSDNEQKALLDAVNKALGEQKDNYLNELIKAYDTYFEKNLFPVLEGERDLIAITQEYKEFIDTRILWIQSAPTLNLDDFQRFGTAIAWILSPSSWAQIITDLGNNLRNNFFIVIVQLLFIIGLLVFQRRLKQKLSSLGRYVTKLSKAKYTDTLWAGVVTILMSIPVPLLLYLIAWHINQSNSDSVFAAAISSGLSATAFLLFIGLLLRCLCRKEGLGEAHFRWKSESLVLIRQQLAWYLPLTLPLVFIIAATLDQPIQAHHDSLGRVAFFALMAISTLIVYRLMHPANGLLKLDIEKNPEGWLNRLTGIWFPALVLTPLGLAVAAGLGYMYTAVQLELHIISTIYLLFAVTVVRGFFIRWLNIAQRKLALEQMRKRILAQADHTVSNESPQTGESAEPSISEESEVDVSAINTQTTKLLNSAFWFAIVVGMAVIWAEVLPAFNMLNEVVLWSSEVTAGQGGAELMQEHTTLADLILAIIILLMTLFVSRNIPGLLEIAILQRLPFTPSGRYAITSIVRYILVIIGLAMTFSAMGIGWSKVQWLAAAITVGLGFGLQEIFANFVSGLIILFERPVRVGDSVTIGNVSGKVSRIQMRATTVIDWDRKELIIPNKEFITGQVINWSLSDTILRILIPVGIAYGSDTKLAYDTLLSIAKAQPNVLEDPESTVRFSAFGESTLDFELRVFVPHPDLLLETRHQLLMEIDQRFRDAGIEIAFPQRDIHIKDFSQENLFSISQAK